MITNNSYRKLPIIRRYTAKNIPDNKCMRKTNLRKTYIPFCVCRLDTQNMSVIEIFYDFQIYTKLGSGLSLILKLENWTKHLITFLKAEAKMKIALKYSTFLKNHEGKLNYGT